MPMSLAQVLSSTAQTTRHRAIIENLVVTHMTRFSWPRLALLTFMISPGRTAPKSSPTLHAARTSTP